MRGKLSEVSLLQILARVQRVRVSRPVNVNGELPMVGSPAYVKARACGALSEAASAGE
jgi:hypothetical protein